MKNDIYSQQRSNRKTTFLLMLAFFVLVVLVGFAVDVYLNGSLDLARPPVAAMIAGGVASVNGLVSFYWGDSLVLFSTGAVEMTFDNPSHKRLHNIVTEMALASGLPMPRVFVIPDESPNAFATGRGPESASIAVTQGLLDAMTREEVQAVVAHEMGHIRSRDILTMTVVAVLVGTVSLLSDWAVRSWRYGGIRPRRGGRQKGLHPLILLAIAFFILLSPVVSRIIAMAVSRSREYQADASSAEFTRNPGALASALEKIAASAPAMRSARRGTAHLFISDPLKRRLDEKEGFFADVFSTHPPIERRIERLKGMAYIYNKGVERPSGNGAG